MFTSRVLPTLLLSTMSACIYTSPGHGNSSSSLSATTDSLPSTITTDNPPDSSSATPTTTASSLTSTGGSATTADSQTAATSGDETSGTSEGTSDTTTDDTTTGGPVSTLCSRLGGTDDGIPDLVNNFLGKVLVDEKINGYFLNSDVDGGALGTCVIKQLGELAGCEGVTYDCLSMTKAHAGLKISQQDFDDFVVDFIAAYDEHAASHPELTDQDKTDIGGALGGMAGEIIEDAASDKTIYQRVGRKPAIKALIGAPDVADSFVSNVALDAAINGFFGASDFERLNTCLTRQVSSIDGPIKYGLEVDAPGGVDPGVGAANPCRDMKTSHTGLVDDMASEITIDDFSALATDLIISMTTAGIPAADQVAILTVLGPMCDDIVADPNTCPGNSTVELVEAVDININIDGNGDNWDDKYNGSIASMLCTELIVPDSDLQIVGDMTLKIGMDHTYVGDLTIKVVSPDNKIFTPLSRPGPEAPLKDDGGPCCGDDSNLNAMFPFTLSDSAVVSGKDMGKSLNTNQIICKDENPKIEPCEFLPFPGLAPGKAFSDYKGDSAPGSWKVCIGDSGKGDFGKLMYVGLNIERVKYAPK